MAQRQRFTGEFKTQVVLELLSGTKSAAELCRQHQLSPQLLGQWKSELLARAPQIFEQERIAELERLVGRLTMQLEIAKKASTLLGAQPSRNDR